MAVDEKVEETAEEIATREAKEAQDKVDAEAKAETDRIAAEDKAEMDSFGDFGDTPPAEEVPNAPPEEEAKKPSDVPGPGEPGYVDPSKKEEPQETEAEKKLREQVENINKANRDIREENKTLKDRLDKVEKPAEPKKEVEVDPDVQETVDAAIDKKNAKDEQKTIDDRVKAGMKSAEAAKETHGEAEYNRITDGYFGPALDNDPDLLKKFQASDNPGEFAYQEGKKLYEKAQEETIKTAEEKGRRNAIEEIKDLGIPVSLTSVPGSSPKINKAPEKRDFDDF